tara:strand:- start:400 stop:1314 length:915 start_codon:yes stop_codon:yes gene_type:complete
MSTLLEYQLQSPRSLQVDRDNGLVKGVKVLGSVSRNKRIYSPQALSDAAGLYEGVRVFLGHDTRLYQDCVGTVHNTSVVGDSVYGDLRLKRSHYLYETIMDDAEGSPESLALSHEVMSGDYEYTEVSEGMRIDSISKVDAVAIVVDGGTCKSLLEENIPVANELKSVEQLKEEHPELVEELKGEFDSAHKDSEKAARLIAERDEALSKVSELQEKLDAIDAETALQERKESIQAEARELNRAEISEELMEEFVTMKPESVTSILKTLPEVVLKEEVSEEVSPTSTSGISSGQDNLDTPFWKRGN